MTKHAEDLAKLGWQYFECPACGSEGARAFPNPTQQEPVAHRDDFWCADLTCKKCYSADFRFKHKNSVVNESLTTPAQRTWVGLTDEERDDLLGNYITDEGRARAIEAKLKEKNK